MSAGNQPSFRKFEYPKSEQFGEGGKYKPEELQKETQEILASLDQVNQEKYTAALIRTREIIAARGYDPEAYQVYLQDKPDGALAVYQRVTTNQSNFVTLQARHIREASLDRLTVTLVHEILGHALQSTNWHKKSTSTESGLLIAQSGYSLDKEKVFTSQDLLRTAYNLTKDLPLNRQQEEVVQFIHTAVLAHTSDEPLNKQAVIENLRERARDDRKIVDAEEFGKDLNEGVTEILAIRATTAQPEQRQALYDSSPYRPYVSALLKTADYLENVQAGLGEEWLVTLESAQQSGNYKPLRDFLELHSGQRVSPRQLANLRLDTINDALDKRAGEELLSKHGLDPQKEKISPRLSTLEQYPTSWRPYLTTAEESQKVLRIITEYYPTNTTLLLDVLKNGVDLQLPRELHETLIYQNSKDLQVSTWLNYVSTKELDLDRLLRVDSPRIQKVLVKNHKLPVETQLELATVPALQLDFVTSPHTDTQTLEYLAQRATKNIVKIMAQSKIGNA